MEEPYYQFPDPSFKEEMVTSFCNFMVVGLIMLFYLSLLSPLFSGMFKFLMIGFFSLTMMMILIFGDPLDDGSWVRYGRIDKNKRKPGDHIYSWRSGYSYAHHGICARDGNVIHFSRGAGQGYGTGTGFDPFIFNSSSSHSKGNPMNPCPRCGDQSDLDGVISSCIECFLSGGDLYLFQYSASGFNLPGGFRWGTFTLFPSKPHEDVLNRAEALLRTNNFGVYNILNNNCENFALYCKMGIRYYSGQVSSLSSFFLGPLSTLPRFLSDFWFDECQRDLWFDEVVVQRLRLWWLWLFGVMIVLMICLLVPCGPC